MAIKIDDDLGSRFYRSYLRLKRDIRADDQELDRRFERAMDAIRYERTRHHRFGPARRRRPLRTARGVGLSGRQRAAATTAVAALTTVGGTLQGILGALVSLSAGMLMTGAAAMALYQCTLRRDKRMRH
ncbi:hypothetical protein [Streptomyces mirabilis]|uniref:hypothetical protein n=1 Tax=Streptomyces mirabilis TaxID=68239 RepID=UPI003677048D